MPDQFSSRYQESSRRTVRLRGSACKSTLGYQGAAVVEVPKLWRSLYGSDEKLDDEHLMRMAGRFSRRLHARAQANKIQVVDCGRGEREHLTAEQFLAHQTPPRGLFLILVGKAPGPVWHVQKTSRGSIANIARKEPWPYVNHHSWIIFGSPRPLRAPARLLRLSQVSLITGPLCNGF